MVSIDSSALSKKFANISVIANEVKQSKSQIVVFYSTLFVGRFSLATPPPK